MSDFKFPFPFVPNFAMFFEYEGQHFQVQVRDDGLVTPAGCAPVLQWVYGVYMGNKRVHEGQFFWDPSDPSIGSKDVAEVVAGIYIEVLQTGIGMSERELMLDEIVRKCADHILMEWNGGLLDTNEYDIIQSVLGDDGGWTVVLEMKFCSRLFFYNKRAADGQITCTTYVKAHQHYITRL